MADLKNSIVWENKMPSEWDDSFIFKGEAIDRGNCYCGLKLTQHELRMVEWIIEVIICYVL